MVRGFRAVGRRHLQTPLHDGEEKLPEISYTTKDPICRDALTIQEMIHTRKACQDTFDHSIATLKLLNLHTDVSPCALCSFSDFQATLQDHPLAWIHTILNPSAVMIVLQRHGIFKHSQDLVRTAYTSVHLLRNMLHHENGSSLYYFIEDKLTNQTKIVLDEKIIPENIVKGLYRLQNSFISKNMPNYVDTAGTNTRRLLFFRELVRSIEQGVKEGWDQTDRLNNQFVQSVSLMYNYEYGPQKERDTSVLSWPPYSTTIDGDSCSELTELLNITVRVTNGIMQGLLTLTDRREELQRIPATSLREAWPNLTQAKGEFAPPDSVLVWNTTNPDPVVEFTSTVLQRIFTFLGFKPSLVYDLFFSIITVGKDSFQCPYEVIQTCSEWRVRLWQGFIIVTFWFSCVSLVAGIFGLSFFSMFLMPLHSFVLLQLCYGYTWTCVPMIPICAWQDFSESFNTIFPLLIYIPDELKRTEENCIISIRMSASACTKYAKQYITVIENNGTHCRYLARYPTTDCLRTCQDVPFEYTTALNVIAWGLAEIGDWVVKWVGDNADRIPLLDDQKFVNDVQFKAQELERSNPSMIRAQRICAGLSSYMLIPWILLVLVLIVYLTTLIQLVGTQFYPFILCIMTLFAAVSVKSYNDNTNKDAIEDDYIDFRMPETTQGMPETTQEDTDQDTDAA